MKVLLLLAVSFIGSQCVTIDDLANAEWDAFKQKYNKHYPSPQEDTFRMKVFIDNSHFIVKHNTKNPDGYLLKINKYGDLFHDEFVQQFNGFNPGVRKTSAIDYIPPANVELRDVVDWRKKEVVTEVKDQGDNCRSCWTFSATGSLEGQHSRLTNKLVSLSEQNLIDCSSRSGNNGCKGGNMQNSFDDIKNNGIDTDTSYPYLGKDGKCHYKPENKGADVKGYAFIPLGNETVLKAAVATIGPISAAIDASSDEFQFYSEGIYSSTECSSTNLDRAILIVGYGTDENKKDYWLVKNSLGTDWGMQGYFKLARNDKNMCGIATEACFPFV